MKIGVMIGADGTQASLDDVIGIAREAELAGLDNVWMANIFGFDAVSTLALIGRETSRIGLGTAVTPTYPRHPTALAQQALTTAAASNNRFILGIGLSHKIVIEDMLGMSYDKPARHMREYLKVLMPLVRGETASFQGDEYRVNGIRMDVPGATDMPVAVAALGPVMLKLAGTLADGTITWMVGAKTMENHIVASLNEQLAIYGQLPSYRAMLDREGAQGPADIAILGDENALRGEIQRLESAGVTDFNAAIVDVEEGARSRTMEFLSSLKG
jgi:alkanesulfonate monooxygenase SsuD/methylene tetrahydromethanopterin reductase-like flavin-dependent oxidoreductase (luciferase family)